MFALRSEKVPIQTMTIPEDRHRRSSGKDKKTEVTNSTEDFFSTPITNSSSGYQFKQ